VSSPGAGNGTPWEAAIVNDWVGFFQSLLTYSGTVPSGAPDKVGASQYLDAVKRVISSGVPVFQDVPAMLSGVDVEGNSVILASGRRLVTLFPVTTDWQVTTNVTDYPLTPTLYAQQLDGNERIALSMAVADAKLKARVQRAGQFEIAGSVSILGDSITVGEGATALENSYASVVQRTFADFQTGGYGPNNEVNFNWTSMGGVALTGQTAGTSGPIQRSQIISVGGTITVTRPNATKMAFFYDQTPSSGIVEVRQNAVLLATIDCSGTAAKSRLSQYVNISAGGANVQFLVTGAPVEFLAIVPIADNANQPNVTMSMRMAVSGWNSSDFLADPNQLISVGECGGIGGSDSIFVLAVGTNDIYTAARPPVEYKANLKDIGEKIQSFRQSNVIVLTVPPIPDETLFPPAISDYTHADYRREVYNLAEEKGWTVVDYSLLNFAGRSLYVDGLHPNDRGHQEMAATLLSKMGLMIEPPLSGVESAAISAKSDAQLFRRSADLTTFTGTTTREKTLTSMGVTGSDFINGIYLRWKTSGVMIPIEHCQDFAGSGNGIQVLRSFTGADYSVAKMFYRSPLNDGEGFAASIGPLSGSIIPGYTDVEVIVEFTRSLKIDSNF